MFERIKSIFAPARAKTVFKSVKARFDAAQTTKDNARHWSAADALSADGEASPEVRRTLRTRSRYEIANNSYARGLVQMLANDTIGTGPRLQMLTEDEAFNDDAEAAFAKWSEAVMLPQKLRTMRIARCQDGEAFAVLDTNPGIRDPVKLGLTLIEADRVSGEPRWQESDGEVDGIRFDQWGNPESYRVLKRHPGDALAVAGDEAVIVPAGSMVHIFRRDRPGLHRGIPELTPALDLFAQLRRYSKAVLSAAEAAADFAAVLYTDAPPDGESEDIEALDTIPLERNMMVTMPAGWKMGQLDPKQPSSTHAEAVKCYLSEIARCVSCTYGAVAGDFSGFNYASGRLDNQVYHKSILVDRSCWETEVLNRVFEAWFREWLLLRGETMADDTHTWFWDGFPHVDPVKEATAQAQRLASCTTTLAAECARDGRDYMAVLRQRGKELKAMRELGIPITANGNNIPETGKE
ncbi:MAG TPA: phage portal protein, partial [Vicinamibacterales bacterium]|nr:phage portal protein [Vicinamibacterales bacterium]